ncbi:MAG: hypothetical protein AMXMBFR45_00560 [Gammaproteobacteria bacterium]|nr:MAG: hypothetical protein EDM71_08965 [Pseudomonadota bacterium]MBC6945856.1 hypothetical protein [Gammaproteobacteria bacterium]MCE7895445.1 hypothetical protein [Gammaproteobacteria bacterium PRO8]MDL1879842.1 hypothetical protein [Gammaproteobacteria bacterium PRO2]MCL4776904.1 hypothetical protein [Gammaproteobacteria bacterium]
MFSVLILVMAAAGFLVCLWAFGEWRRTRSVILLFNVLVLAAAVVHALIAGSGRWAGPGTELRGLYVLPLLVATVALPAALFTFATISRGSGFAWARIDWGHGGVCLLAVALLIYSLPGIFVIPTLAPACWRDVVWYLPSVPPPLFCPGAAPELVLPPRLPVVPAVVVAAYLGLGAGLWYRQGWPWLLAGMAAGTALLLLPLTWGPVPRFAGELLCAGVMALAAVRYVRSQPPPAGPAADGPAG